MDPLVELVQLLQRILHPEAFLLFRRLPDDGELFCYQLILGQASWVGSSATSASVAKREAAAKALRELRGISSPSLQGKLGMSPAMVSCGVGVISAQFLALAAKERQEDNDKQMIDFELFCDTSTLEQIDAFLRRRHIGFHYVNVP